MPSHSVYLAQLFLPFMSQVFGQDTINCLQADISEHDPVMIKQSDTDYMLHACFGVSIKTAAGRIHGHRERTVFSKPLPDWAMHNDRWGTCFAEIHHLHEHALSRAG